MPYIARTSYKEAKQRKRDDQIPQQSNLVLTPAIMPTGSELLSPALDAFVFPYGTNAHFPLRVSSTMPHVSQAPAVPHSPTQRTRSFSLSSKQTEEFRQERNRSIIDLFKTHEQVFDLIVLHLSGSNVIFLTEAMGED